MKPLDRGDLKAKDFVVFDIESKNGPTQEMGFSRPFDVGFYDGETYVEFRNDGTGRCAPAFTRNGDYPDSHPFAGLDAGVLVGDVCFPAPPRSATFHPCGRCTSPYRPRGKSRVVAGPACETRWAEWHLSDSGCVSKFLRYLFSSGKQYQAKKRLIYSHNGGKFDMLFVLGWLLRHRDEFTFELASVQSKIQRLDVWPVGSTKKKGCWSFLDSVSLMPMTLEKVGQTFCRGLKDDDGKPLGKRKMDLSLPEWAPEWAAYLKDDCRVLYHGLVAFQAMIMSLGGEIGITAPATAMKLYRRKFQKEWIAINEHFPDCDGKCKRRGLDDHGHHVECEREDLCDGSCHGCLHEFVREGDYGGRTEHFRSWGHNLLYFDINSSYPASMRDPMPIGAPVVIEGGTWASLSKRRAHSVGFVEAEVEIPQGCKLPPLPYRVPEGARVAFKQPDGTETVVPPGKLIFPTGKLRGVWDYDELCLVLHPLVGGRIVKVHRSVWFKAKPIFIDFVDTLYAYRNKDDPKNYAGGVIERDAKGDVINEDDFNSALAEACKLMLNSLYGKFGMRPERSGLELCLHPEQGPEAWPENGWPIDGDHDKCLVWEVDRLVKAPYIIPQISAHITALSRIRLFHGMADVLAREGGVVYYCDTDSIVTNLSIPSSAQLGGWKQENPKDALLCGTFVLPKLYQLQFHKLDCPWVGYDPEEAHLTGEPPPDFCPGCKSTKMAKGKVSLQKMKGVGSRAQTPENWNHMVNEGGSVHYERLAGFRSILNSATNAEKIDGVNLGNGGPMLSPVVVDASKSVRSRYDKRQLLRGGGTIPVHIAA